MPELIFSESRFNFKTSVSKLILVACRTSYFGSVAYPLDSN